MQRTYPALRTLLSRRFATILLGLIFFFNPFGLAQAQNPVVKAILFYSPTCGHCEYVILQVLPGIIEKYGESLQIVGVNIASESGNALFDAAAEHFKVEYKGVPLLLVGDQVLMGSVEIPERFPGLIDKYLSQGGADWPAVPGLAEAMAAAHVESPSPTLGETSPSVTTTPAPLSTAPAGAAPTPLPATSESVHTPTGEPPTAGTHPPSALPEIELPGGLNFEKGERPGLMQRLKQDPAGNALAILVLLGMITAFARTMLRVSKLNLSGVPERGVRWIPWLALIGIGISGYLAYVETQSVQAVCGPVGDCNTVQQSEYAHLFGVLPIGVLGVIGFAAILLVWAAAGRMDLKIRPYAWLLLRGMAVFGALFSIYLTFLEPFVIGATCAWCLGVAILISVIFYLTWSSPLGENGKIH